MVGFVITKREKNYFTLLSDDEREIELLIEFYGIDPGVGDVICFNEELLDRRSEKFCQPYAFQIAYVPDYIDDGEYMALRKNGVNYILKRVYG